MTPSTIIIDDTDPRVQYVGLWDSAGVMEEHNHTTHGTYERGSQAILKFSGSSVAVYGTLANTHRFAPVSTYAVDELPPYTFRPSRVNGVYHRQLFYQSPPLEDGEHVLTITSTIPNSAFWLDYFQVTSTKGSIIPGGLDRIGSTWRNLSISDAIIHNIAHGSAFLIVFVFFLWLFRRLRISLRVRRSVSRSRRSAPSVSNSRSMYLAIPVELARTGPHLPSHADNQSNAGGGVFAVSPSSVENSLDAAHPENDVSHSKEMDISLAYGDISKV